MTKTKTQVLPIDVESIAERVLANRGLWIPRTTADESAKDYPEHEARFYTMGRASYLDGNTPAYWSDSLARNAELMRLFSALYAEILKYFKKELNEPVYLATDLAIPGFHIFESNPAFLEMGGDWHIDYPHTTLGLGSVDASTFTVPIMLPTGGAGLDQIGVDGEIHYLPYKEGELVWHTGLQEHRLAKLRTYVPNEYRITLQGHLIRREGDMEVFF